MCGQAQRHTVHTKAHTQKKCVRVHTKRDHREWTVCGCIVTFSFSVRRTRKSIVIEDAFSGCKRRTHEQ